jgi:methionine-rich copper-binding protein CopC
MMLLRRSLPVGLMVLGLASAAWAHANLDKAEPKVGGKVTTSPKEVKIWFTDDTEVAKSTIAVFDAKGKQVDKKDTHADGKNTSVLIVSVPTLATGTYKVEWHAVCPSAHKTEGTFEFTIADK